MRTAKLVRCSDKHVVYFVDGFSFNVIPSEDQDLWIKKSRSNANVVNFECTKLILFIRRWLNQVTHEFRDQTLFSVDDMVSRK